ncbi:BAG family molecular chaperone regulator 4-like isoform X1 [Rosa rugosa]|uniref:BAG family molecular chaperone regulator 4-like isoform X1 n=1 Tax=Rosa rugosa TaxID=74645 RepID=UPI002B401360|nr:BAG family molecular chaperone regulator 4-like isoform X1 [Rosa rugosa]
MKKRSKRGVEKDGYIRQIDWELRPGGMLVQKRDTGDASSGPMIKIKVSHDSYYHDVTVHCRSTFGDLKRILANETGLEPKAQRLLYRGKEKDDVECLHIAGVKDMSKIMLLEDPASKEKKLEEMNKNQGILKAYEEVAKVRAQVDKLSQKIENMETTLCNGTKVADTEIVVLTELLMVELLKLDSIEADGEAKVQRRVEVRRVQSFVDTLDNLKARNSNPFSKSSNSVSVTTNWESFELGVGSLHAPTPLKSSTKITQDWELFD